MPQVHSTLHTLIDQIASRLAVEDQHLITALREELASHPAAQPEPGKGPLTARLDTGSGCYQFGDDPAYYCPLCYDQLQQKIATQRLNRKLRVCPQCRASLRPL
jgi:hypothetical protein